MRKENLQKKSPPNTNKFWRLVLLVMALALSSISMYASRNYGDDCFNISYEADKARYKITLLVHHDETSGAFKNYGVIKDAVIGVKKGNGSWEDLLYISGDGYFSTTFYVKYYKSSGAGYHKSTRLSTSSQSTTINQGGQVSTYFYWYPDESWVGSSPSFCLRSGWWDRRNNTDDYNFGHSFQKTSDVMTNKTNTISVTENAFTSDGKNRISYSIQNFNSTHDKGTVHLQRYNGSYWVDIANKTAASSGTFEDKYMLDENSFKDGVRFRVENRVTPDASWYNAVVFRRTSTEVQTSKYATFRTFEAKQDGKNLKLSWTYNTVSGAQNEDGLELLILKDGGTNWSNAVKRDITFDKSKANGEAIYELSNDELQKGNKTYKFRIRKKSFAVDGLWKAYFQKDATISSVNTNYQVIKTLNYKTSGTSVILDWTLDNTGIPLTSDLQYIVKVNGVTNALAIPIANKTCTIAGLDKCKNMAISLSLIIKEGNKVISEALKEDVIITNDTPSRITDLTVSKGYYTDKVMIDWSIPDNANNFKYFVLSRKQIDADLQPVTLAQIDYNKKIYSYADDGIDAGVYYEYFVTGYTECNDITSEVAQENSIGFSQPYASVTGRIAYNGNQAVEGVDVMVIGEAGTTQNRGLDFSSTRQGGKYVSVPQKALNAAAFTYQVWVKPTAGSDDKEKVILMNSYADFRASIKNSKIHLISENNVYSDTTNIEMLKYFHFTVTANQISGNNYDMQLFINGHLANKFQISLKESAPALIFGANNSQTMSFDGYMDEFRVWTRVLSVQEIASNYDRFLTGKESGLSAYYRCDELDQIGQVLFDISAVKSNFNKNDGTFGDAVLRTTQEEEVPSKQELSNKARTDQYGNYLINTIPYTNEGNVYNIIPLYGVHKFSPNSRPVFVSPSSRSLNNIDFTDNSSFEVSGRITYENTDYPVEGVSFYVDGIICSKDNEMIKSKADGTFTISVPIGEHHITVEKEGHTFVNKGRYPADPQGVGAKVVIENPITNLQFVDNTLVTVAGRVSGGEIEGAIPLGFGASKANVGKATITLQIPDANKYSLNETGAKLNLNTGNDFINNTAYIDVQQDKVVIETNSKNGEFVVKLPPIPFKVIDINTKKLDKATLGISNIANFEITNPNITYTDSIEIENGKMERFKYHHAIKVNYRVPYPTMLVTDKATYADAAFGEEFAYYTDEVTNKTDTIQLYKIDELTQSVTYKFGYPVFFQKNKYTFNLSAFEEYENWDNADNEGDGIVIDQVPLKESIVTIANEIGIQSVYIEGANTGEIAELNENEVELDEEGKATYHFTSGFPNINDGHLLTLNIQYMNGDKRESWSENGNFKAYVFGMLPSGSDFVTAGPDKVSMILRDPPGSESSAFWEVGTTHTHTETQIGAFSTSNNLTSTIHAGLDEKVITGTPAVGVITEAKSKADIEIGLGFEYSFENNQTKVNTTTLTKRISTSDSPDFVGSSGDVFIGNSTNMLFGVARNVGLKKNVGENFTIEQEEVMTMGSEFGTAFRYTANHIENYLIPDLIALRNSLLREVSPQEYNESYPNHSDVPIYITKLTKGDRRFASNNDDVDMWGAEVVASDKLGGPSYIMILPTKNDTVFDNKVVWYNSQVEMWENTLAQNEKVKLEAFAGKVKDNYSFDAGTSIDSETTTCSSSSNEWTHEYKTQIVAGVKTGFQIKGVGVSMEFKSENTGSFSKGSSDEDEKCITTGYSLVDGDAGNYFSVDVFEPSDNFGVIFRTRGGQSSCPFEDAEITKYYKPGTELSPATVQIEVPKLSVDKPFATDIPSGKEATYILTLNNNSEAKEDAWFNMRVLDETNPNGASLAMDASQLAGVRREIFVKAGESLKKTLKLKQTSQDHLDYQDIKIVLASNCEDEIADTITISAQFVPTCTDITMEIEDRIVNVETSDTLAIKVKDYEMSYTNFKAIRIQYKSVSDISWNLVQEYVLDPANKTQTNELLQSASIIHNFPMTALSDGVYEIRTVSVCDFGNGEVFNETPVIQIVKDMAPPASLGRPSPSNGILTPEGEISILFNEDIQSGKLTASNFKVKGVLNGYTVRDNVGLDFDGSSNAYSEFDITANASFSIEGWFKRELSSEGTLFTYGKKDDFISVGFTTDDKLIVKTETNESATSTIALTDKDWQYISFVFDRSSNKVQAYLNSNAQGNISLFTDKSLKNDAPQTGRLYLGSDINGENAYKGRIRQVHFWNKAREQAELKDMNQSKAGNEQSLVGYWNLEEGYGNVAEDKARNRNMIVNSDWFIHPTGKSVSFNGSNDYLTLDSKLYPFDANTNFSIEFWFKGSKKSVATLLSVGHGVKDNDVNGKLSIATDNKGYLVLRTSGNEHQLVSKNLMDNQWHHFAMSVARGGNVVTYIDNEQTFQASASEIGRMAAKDIYIGASSYTTESGKVTDEYFDGSVDELRIWNSTLTSENFKLNRYNKLSGEEIGLVAYYPFEKYSQDSGGQEIISESLNDMVVSDGAPSSLVAGGTATHSSNTPPIKDQRPVEDVSFNWTASDNKVVVNLLETSARIENCILEFTVDRVLDKQNNRMASPVIWTAYINTNRLQWENESVSLSKDVYAPLSFKTTISNNSGVNETYVISNVPSWLSCNNLTGTLSPQQSKELTFVINEAVGIGTYEANLTLTGNNNISEIYVVSLKVNGETPNWTVDQTQYEASMTLTGQLKIENIFQEDADDIVAAFIDGECRGIVSPEYIKVFNSYYLFMDIYGNESDKNKAVEFRVWDASTGRIFTDVEISENVGFVSLGQKGSLAAPIVLNALNIIDQKIALKKGWNWISVNVESQNPSLLDIFKSGIGDAGLIMKNSTGYIQYPRWSGSMTTMTNTSMYRLQTSKDHNISFTGSPVNVKDYPISINKGWNWIGYLPSGAMSVNEALASIEAQTGDQIKGHVGYATYVVGAGWIGSLKYMQPGQGYIYNSLAGNETLVYPATSSLRNASLRSTEASTYWSASSTDFQDNMTITAVVYLDNIELTSDKYELAVFSGSECRGTIMLQYEDHYNKHLAYLMAYGNGSEKLTFRLYNHNIGKEVRVNNSEVDFVSDGILGLTDPYKVSLVTMGVGIEDNLSNSSLVIYPNPVTDYLWYNLPMIERVSRVEVRDVSGKVLIIDNKPQTNAVNVEALAAGTYFIHVYMDNAIEVAKFIKK